MGDFPSIWKRFTRDGIPYRVYAVADRREIGTDSGRTAHGRRYGGSVLKGHAERLRCARVQLRRCRARVRPACRRAVQSRSDGSDQGVRRQRDRIVIGHCAAGMMFEKAGVASGRKLSAACPAAPEPRASFRARPSTSLPPSIGDFWTARDEGTIWTMMPRLLEESKKVSLRVFGDESDPVAAIFGSGGIRRFWAAGFRSLRRKCYLCSQTDNKVRYFLENFPIRATLLLPQGKGGGGPAGRPVQQAVQQALSTLLRHETPVVGAGRTDTGVHASFYVARFRTRSGRWTIRPGSATIH